MPGSTSNAARENVPAPPDCNACRHFWITHEPVRPYGCHAFGFVSRRLPSSEVRASSGRECQAFEAKPRRDDPRRDG